MIFQQKSLTEDCIFREHRSFNGYSVFESSCHSGWYLALSKDGRVKPGPRTAPDQTAVQFLEANFDDHASWLLGHSKPLVFKAQTFLKTD